MDATFLRGKTEELWPHLGYFFSSPFWDVINYKTNYNFQMD